MEILFDTLGSERGTETVVRAGFLVHEKFGVNLAFIGLRKHIQHLIDQHPKADEWCRIVDCSEAVGMAEYAPEAAEKKENASVNLAMRELKSGHADALSVPVIREQQYVQLKIFWDYLIQSNAQDYAR
ncbi:hypothetical protein K8T06_09630 [bacterium]|nr:hypothetical protein [bacterium]